MYSVSSQITSIGVSNRISIFPKIGEVALSEQIFSETVGWTISFLMSANIKPLWIPVLWVCTSLLSVVAFYYWSVPVLPDLNKNIKIIVYVTMHLSICITCSSR